MLLFQKRKGFNSTGVINDLNFYEAQYDYENDEFVYDENDDYVYDVYTPTEEGQYLTCRDSFTYREFGVYEGDGFDEGDEIMIHVTAPQSSDSAEYPLVGLYGFAKVKRIALDPPTGCPSIELETPFNTANGYDFTLNAELIENYYVQVIQVPHFRNFTINEGITLKPDYWNSSFGGGIIAFRCTGDCTINGSIITHGQGAIRYDAQQMTHSKLINRFLCSQGGGIFIACGGTFTAPSTARLGATWSGYGNDGNGAAGYGGDGGSSSKATGGAGGVGGGGGGASQYSTSYHANGGACGSNGANSYLGSGGGGCGGVGGKGTNSTYGAGGACGGGQGNSGGAGGTGTKVEGNAGTINGGDYKAQSTYYSGAGGGGAGGNSGLGQTYTSNSANYVSGKAGASIILICDRLNVDEEALYWWWSSNNEKEYSHPCRRSWRRRHRLLLYRLQEVVIHGC